MVVSSERYSKKQVLRKNGGDDETRTRDLCRDGGPLIGFTTTYKTAGTANGRIRRSKSSKAPHSVGRIVGWKFLGKNRPGRYLARQSFASLRLCGPQTYLPDRSM